MRGDAKVQPMCTKGFEKNVLVIIHDRLVHATPFLFCTKRVFWRAPNVIQQHHVLVHVSRARLKEPPPTNGLSSGVADD